MKKKMTAKDKKIKELEERIRILENLAHQHPRIYYRIVRCKICGNYHRNIVC